MYQGPNALDSVLHYPMYDAIVNTFAIPGQQNMTALTDMIAQSKQKFKVVYMVLAHCRLLLKCLFRTLDYSATLSKIRTLNW